MTHTDNMVPFRRTGLTLSQLLEMHPYLSDDAILRLWLNLATEWGRKQGLLKERRPKLSEGC